jgi:uncharacterized protein YgiM (DUF1202 family)
MTKCNFKSKSLFVAVICAVAIALAGCNVAQVKMDQPSTSASSANKPERSQTSRVQYNDYGKPVDTTRGRFTVKQAVNLRARADSSSAVLAVLPAGKTVTVNKAVHGYYEISYDGKTGYSWHKFFSPN